MAKKEYTAAEYAELLIEQLRREHKIEARESMGGIEHFEIKAGWWKWIDDSSAMEKGVLKASVHSDGGVNIVYEVYIPDAALHSYELMHEINYLNASPGATFYLDGDRWVGAKFCVRRELCIEGFTRAAAKRVLNGIERTEIEILYALEELQRSMSDFFGLEEIERAAAEANRSPEELFGLPEAYEAPPQEEYADGAEFFDESVPEEIMPEWYEEWGDEQAFYERFKDVPVSELSGSELMQMWVTLERQTDSICEKLRRTMEQIRKNAETEEF